MVQLSIHRASNVIPLVPKTHTSPRSPGLDLRDISHPPVANVPRLPDGTSTPPCPVRRGRCTQWAAPRHRAHRGLWSCSHLYLAPALGPLPLRKSREAPWEKRALDLSSAGLLEG